jgi:hypothetical protein
MCFSSIWQFPLEYADQKSNDVRAWQLADFLVAENACQFEPQVIPGPSARSSKIYRNKHPNIIKHLILSSIQIRFHFVCFNHCVCSCNDQDFTVNNERFCGPFCPTRGIFSRSSKGFCWVKMLAPRRTNEPKISQNVLLRLNHPFRDWSLNPEITYPLVISYSLRTWKWPSRNSWFPQLHSMVDLSSSFSVNVYPFTGYPKTMKSMKFQPFLGSSQSTPGVAPPRPTWSTCVVPLPLSEASCGEGEDEMTCTRWCDARGQIWGLWNLRAIHQFYPLVI